MLEEKRAAEVRGDGGLYDLKAADRPEGRSLTNVRPRGSEWEMHCAATFSDRWPQGLL